MSSASIENASTMISKRLKGSTVSSRKTVSNVSLQSVRSRDQVDQYITPVFVENGLLDDVRQLGFESLAPRYEQLRG